MKRYWELGIGTLLTTETLKINVSAREDKLNHSVEAAPVTIKKLSRDLWFLSSPLIYLFLCLNLSFSKNLLQIPGYTAKLSVEFKFIQQTDLVCTNWTNYYGFVFYSIYPHVSRYRARTIKAWGPAGDWINIEFILDSLDLIYISHLKRKMGWKFLNFYCKVVNFEIKISIIF